MSDEREYESGELCKYCGNRYITIYTLPDELWKKINDDNEDGLVCPSCIDNIAREKGITLYWEAREKNYPTYEKENDSNQSSFEDTLKNFLYNNKEDE